MAIRAWMIGVAIALVGCGAGSGSTTDVRVPEDDSVAVPDAVGTHDVLTDLGAVPDAASPDAPGADGGAGDVFVPLSPVEAADPLLGSGAEVFNVGNAVPGATAPFGMVKVSPSSAEAGGAAPEVYHCAGYKWSDTHLYGFGHMHLHGTGVPDYANIRVQPTDGMTDAKTTAKGYLAPKDAASEQASPGYYAVRFADSGILAELTATERAAVHRYTFPAGTTATLLLDLEATAPGGHSGGGAVDVDDAAGTLSGWMHNVGAFSGRYGGFRVYFHARLGAPVAAFGTWTRDGRAPGVAHAETTPDERNKAPLGAWVDVTPDAAGVVELQVGLSLVSVENARANLEAEVRTGDFEAVHGATREAWADALGRIEIEGTSAEEREIFYGSLYHSMMMPTLLTDVDGRYVGVDRQVHEAEDFRYYTDFSMWDTFRTLHPLLTLILPGHARDMARSLVRMGEEGGFVPQWPMGTGETGSMIGTPDNCVIADTYVKGVTDFDAEGIYETMRATALGESSHPREAIAEYLALGYAPDDVTSGSVSKTLEHAYEDFCLANLAEALGRGDDAAMFRETSRNFENLWDPETDFFRGRNTDGSWVLPFLPEQVTHAYTEATAWQYSWFVPHDVPRLIELFGSPEAMVEKLETFFTRAAEAFDFRMPTPYYYHGNEPSLQAAYMFLEAGRPDLAQKWVRWVLATCYRTGPHGLIGNDDAGTIGAWYVFSALGFYPLPGSTRYYVGSPIVSRAVLHLDGGDLVVTAEGQGADRPYVKSVTLNGTPLTVPWFDHEDIAHGGTLEFELSAVPEAWGTL